MRAGVWRWVMAAFAGPVGLVWADPDDLPGGPQTAEEFGGGLEVYGALYPAGSETVNFAVIGDYGAGGVGEGMVATMVKRWLPEFIVTTGDNNYGSLDVNVDRNPGLPGVQCDWEVFVGDYYGEFIQRRRDRKFARQTSVVQRFFPAVGNHDSWPDGGIGGPIDGYVDYFLSDGEGGVRLPVDRGAVHDSAVSYYALRRGPVDLFIMDSDVPAFPELIKRQRDWLAAQVKASTARWKLAVFHHSPVTSHPSRPGATWMAWPELELVDAILCGHDHFYERLLYLGRPLVICGASGAPGYGFSNPPHPASQFRYQGFAAAKVAAHSQGLTIECHSTDAEVPDAIRETLVLGSVAPADMEDVYAFHADAGQTVVVESETPGAPAVGGLDPVLMLCPPRGGVAAMDDNGGADGRNARVTAVAGESGMWRVKVTAATAASGNYTLRLGLNSPGPRYGEWSAGLSVAGPGEDADRDGLANLLEYALGTDGAVATVSPLRVARSGAEIVVTFDVPGPPRGGVAVVLEAGAELTGGSWFPLVERPVAMDWRAADPYATVSVGTPSAGWRRVTARMPSGEERLYFRLRATAVP